MVLDVPDEWAYMLSSLPSQLDMEGNAFYMLEATLFIRYVVKQRGKSIKQNDIIDLDGPCISMTPKPIHVEEKHQLDEDEERESKLTPKFF